MAKIVLTGGSGTLGRALIPKLMTLGPALTVISRSEAKQLDLRAQYPDVEFLLGDVQDEWFLRLACAGASTIVHAAALKHVPISEREPTAYTQVNVCGTLQVLRRAAESNAQVIAISTDKACCPQNVYGLTKLLMERLVVEAGGVAVRYGNVFGSVGSVIPRWKFQLTQLNEIAVTDPEMTRFFFSPEEAVAAVLWSMVNAPAGTVVIPPMRAASLEHLGVVFLDVAGGGTMRVIGSWPGEKQHEMVLSAEEGRFAWRHDSYTVLGRDRVPPDRAHPLPAITSDAVGQISSEDLAQWIRAL